MAVSVNSLVTILSLLFTFSVNASDPGEKEENHAPSGQFDFNVYAVTWQPTWCLKNGKDRCANRFYVHGVWPYFNLPEEVTHNAMHSKLINYHPSYCYNSPGCKSSQDCEIDDQQVLTVMDHPSIKDLYPQSIPLFKHEWHKHGTCSGLKPENYFLQADAYRKMVFPNLEPLYRLIDQHSAPFQVSTSYIESLLPNNTGLRCTLVNGQAMLFEIFFFIDRLGNPHTTQTQIGMDCTGQVVIPVTH
ncbi:ribonuclease T2 family protein [Endozoicomonas lisbonensis]|uniref:Ribonuclease T2 n=1 Tax=Endozoicomonas lisbonensis TaxID=3120522 RepID=A0ABV2SBA2_9GAMM